jgi:Na+/melibiose symporter-like transporter
VVPAVTALTLGMVGKQAFPKQQGRNQAWNHVGILAAALAISFGTPYTGPSIAFWVLGGLSACAIVAAVTTPKKAWNGRRAVGWKEDDPDDKPERSAILKVLSDRRLLILSAALALFNLANGSMLSLLGQKLVAAGQDGTGWTARYVIVAQAVMIPVALFAGSLADRRGRRQLLLVACAVLPARALLSAFLSDPYWLVLAEVLDGVASGVIGVAVPVVVADLTWGSGRTQTALGTVAAVQGVGGALSGWVGGLLALHLGWTWAFLALAIPAGLALLMALWLEETCAPGGQDGAGAACGEAAPAEPRERPVGAPAGP